MSIFRVVKKTILLIYYIYYIYENLTIEAFKFRKTEI